MSRDALFQLGIVPVSLNTSQTEDREPAIAAHTYHARDTTKPLLYASMAMKPSLLTFHHSRLTH